MTFTSKDIQSLGLIEVKPGVFRKPSNKRTVLMEERKAAVKKGRPSADELPVRDYLERGEHICKIILAGRIPGLNGKDGLLREHWTKRKKRKEVMFIRIKNLGIPPFEGMVFVEYIGHSPSLSDWDNFVSQFKLVGDALQRAGVIKDDSPKVIAKFIPYQFKSRRKDERREIIIKSLNSQP